MTQRRRGSNKGKKITAFTAILAVIVMAITPVLNKLGLDPMEVFDWLNSATSSVQTGVAYPSDGTAEVHFIDIGQGSAILIKGSEKTALIDAGEAPHGEIVVDYLKDNGVTKIDYMFNTHPHYDHMGGCLVVMKEIPTANFVMAEVKKGKEPTTVFYEKLLTYLGDNKETITTTMASLGDEYKLGGGLTLNVIGPVDLYNDLNNISTVMRMDFGETSFLFTGDMEEESQQDMVDAGVLTKVNVMESSHHGSNTSINRDFINTVSPDVAVIQCGVDNDYGHPHEETLDLYDKKDIEYYRNDTQGDVKIVTDGKEIIVTTEK